MAFPAAAAISGATGIGGSLIGGWFGMQGAKDANDRNIAHAQREQVWNRENANRANQYNVKQWNRANFYNSPSAQMARLKEAGLNPRLIYGNSANTGNAAPIANAQDVKGYRRPESKNVYEGMKGFGNWANVVKEAAQTDLIKAQTQDVQAAARKKESEKIGIDSHNITEASTAKYSDDQSQYNAQAMGAKVDNIKVDTFGKQIQNQFNQKRNQQLLQSGEQTIQMADVTISGAKTENKIKIQNMALLKIEHTLRAMGTEKASMYIKHITLHPDKAFKIIDLMRANGSPEEATQLLEDAAGLILNQKRPNYQLQQRTKYQKNFKRDYPKFESETQKYFNQQRKRKSTNYR